MVRNRLLAVCLVALAGFAQAGRADAQEELKLTIAAGHANVFLWVRHLQESFIPAVNAELAKSGKYKINWTEAFGGTLAKLGSELETIEQGVADLGFVIIPFHAGKLPLHNLSYVTPFGPTDPAVVNQVMTALHMEVPLFNQAWEKYNQVYLTGFGLENYNLVTTFQFNSLEDLKGKRIGSAAANTSWTKGSGAVGVVSTLPNMYNDMKTGLINGVIMFITAALPAKFYEVAPNFYEINFGAVYGGALTVNRNRWQRLPDEVKIALRTGATVFRSKFEADQSERATSAHERWRTLGKIRPVNDDLRIAFAKSIENPAKAWLVDASKDGRPAQEILRRYMEMLRASGVTFARDWDREQQP